MEQSNKKSISGATIAIIVLSVLLIASLAIGITLAYFTSSNNVTGQISLGDPVNIQITQGGAVAQSLTFDGKALPGTVYDQSIGISAPATMTEALMRAKLTITNTEGASKNVEAQTTESWQEGEDNYYYYNGKVNANNKIDFVTSITVPTTLTNEDANKTFTVEVIVETIQAANNAANSVWSTAPSEWLNQYSPVTIMLDDHQFGPYYSNDELYNNNYAPYFDEHIINQQPINNDEY